MAIKWKSNKRFSIWLAGLSVFILTGVFMAFFPFFEERAESEFENPLTGNNFIRMLYGSNYIQYKYLREKADQKNYNFAELLVDAQMVEVVAESAEEGVSSGEYGVPPAPDEEVLNVYKERTLQEIDQIKATGKELTQLMDYCALDVSTGVSIGNSNSTALKGILTGQMPENNPYVYYVYMNYDGAGNVVGCGVCALDQVDEFLKRVEANSREQIWNVYDENGNYWDDVYDEDTGYTLHYKFSLIRPRNMKIIYAMTNEQYQEFLSRDHHIVNNFYLLPNQVYARQQSYYLAGINEVALSFFFVAASVGAVAPWVFNRGKRRGSYLFQETWFCCLPIEFITFITLVCLSIPYKLVDLVCSYQKGWFLPNLSKHILEPFHLAWIKALLLFFIFYLYFFTAFVIGSILPTMWPLKRYLKKRSLLYRYWDKIITWLKNFYNELVNFDIGRNAKRIISKLVVVNFVILVFISMLWVWGIFPLLMYSLLLYFLLKKYVKDVQNKYQHLLQATSAIARGDLDIALSEDFGVFESYKTELRSIQTDFKRAVEEEVKSQRMKSELITNVSHDLKTPLTAIITYINLLREPDINIEQREEYINMLDKKAVRLKVLIEDLFEVSKATTQNISLNYAKVDLTNLLRQCYLEYEDRIGECQLQFKFMLPDEKVMLYLDPQRTFRIFDNLYTNIIKYALPATRVYVILQETEDTVQIELKNISRTELQIAPEELTERFVRGDSARNTEGSGLGLAIAKSFTELQHGTMEIRVDGDLFKVLLSFRKRIESPEPMNATLG